MSIQEYLQTSSIVLQDCIRHPGALRVEEAISLIVGALQDGKLLLVCGNGGSASDAMHITGELVGRFLKERRALNCLCLSSNASVITAWSNDYSFDTVFARQVEAYGIEGAILLGISTSGNSVNIVEAFKLAKALKMKTIALTGQGGGRVAGHADILIDVPNKQTPFIQQAHICLYHYMCQQIEAEMLSTVEV